MSACAHAICLEGHILTRGGGGWGEGEDLVQRFPDFFFVIKVEYLVIIFSVL